MVAVIRSTRSVARSGQYNEAKVSAEMASCIFAGNYPCEPWELSAAQRLSVLKKRLELNERCQKSTLHIVLSFHPQDKLTDQQLGKISQSYMDQIGMGQQPFLVYRHLDTLTPHVHILTVTIKADGSGIQAFPTRVAIAAKVTKRIEKQFGLTAAVKATGERQAVESAQKLQYGKVQTKQAIAQVTSVVIPNFKFCSLAELNAVLRHYNVIAKIGSSFSKTRLHGGLSYQMLSDDGKYKGVPIKASALPGKPTLKHLSNRFLENQPYTGQHSQRMKTLIELAARAKPGAGFYDLQAFLFSEAVKPVLAVGRDGKVKEIIFVDFRARAAISASALGTDYQPERLLIRFKGLQMPAASKVFSKHAQQQWPAAARTTGAEKSRYHGIDRGQTDPADDGLLRLLIMPDSRQDYLPWELKRRPKRKARQLSVQF